MPKSARSVNPTPPGRGASATPAATALPPAAARVAMADPELSGGSGAAARPSSSDVDAELLALHRFALLGTMTAMVMHEINNIVTPVLARAEAAIESADPQLMRAALERTFAGVQRAGAVSRRLLELAHGADIGVRSCKLADGVREALATVTRPLDRDRIELELSVPDEICVAADRLLLEQLLLNLVLNARRSMAERGGILRIAAQRSADAVLIEVSDTGVGLSAAAIEERFNPFLRADEAGPLDWRDAGLGLRVCRMIAQRCGATLEMAPNPAGGCIVRMHWPAAE